MRFALMLSLVVCNVIQIRDAFGGLTFSKTPAFANTTLQGAPLSFYDQYGDDRNTTYSSDTVTAPNFDVKYARVSHQGWLFSFIIMCLRGHRVPGMNVFNVMSRRGLQRC